MKNDLGNDQIQKLVWEIALPSMIGQFVSVLYSIVDRMYIGHLTNIGVQALAGVGVCGPIVTLIGAFASLIGVGGAPLVAIRMGEKNNAEAKKIMTNAFMMLCVISFVVMILIYPLSKQMLYMFGASASTIDYALSYFQIYLLGTPFCLLATGMNMFITCQGYAKMGMCSVVIGALTNIVLDPIFMFVLNMGVQGAAIATVISQIVSCIFVLSILLFYDLPIRLKMQSCNKNICIQILKLGFTQFAIIAFDNIMIISMNAILQHFGGTLGDTFITVNTIIQSFMLIVTMPLAGISSGTQCILSYNYGAYQVDRVKQAIHYIAKVCMGYCAIMFVIAYVFGQYFILLFNRDTTIISYGMQALRYMTIFIIPLGLQYELVDGMTALGQVKISLSLSFFRKTVYFIALFALPFFFGVQYTFLAEAVSDIAAPILSTIVIHHSLDTILEWRLSMKK